MFYSISPEIFFPISYDADASWASRIKLFTTSINNGKLVR